MGIKVLAVFIVILTILTATLPGPAGASGGITYGAEHGMPIGRAGFPGFVPPFYTNRSQTGSPLNSHDYAKNLIKPRVGQPVKNFTLIAAPSLQEIKKGLAIEVWTFNGAVPGPEIRVTQGDFVQVTLKNFLPEPVTIHWHGYPVISAMDGVPGLNQDAIRPGESFTYQFSADLPGTYWYHSHQESSQQVDRGLYGALIVEPFGKPKPAKDFTIMLDEWMTDPAGMNPPPVGMNMTAATNPEISDLRDEAEMSAMYNVYSVNGRSCELIEPLEVKRGETVRLRLINAGYRTHGLHLPGQTFKIVSTDGREIQGAELIKDQIVEIAPGERYDLEFTTSGRDSFVIDFHDNNPFNDQLRIPVYVTDGAKKIQPENTHGKLAVFDLFRYGKKRPGRFSVNQKFTVEINAVLNYRVDGVALKYTINGKTFRELPPLGLKTGDLVKLTVDNQSRVNHPMHLHGHFFEVLSKNGKPLSGAPITKDTLLVKPGEKYVLAFQADNLGRWVFHCHELHHASSGMMQLIQYSDFKPNYIPDSNNRFNKPE